MYIWSVTTGCLCSPCHWRQFITLVIQTAPSQSVLPPCAKPMLPVKLQQCEQGQLLCALPEIHLRKKEDSGPKLHNLWLWYRVPCFLLLSITAYKSNVLNPPLLPHVWPSWSNAASWEVRRGNNSSPLPTPAWHDAFSSSQEGLEKGRAGGWLCAPYTIHPLPIVMQWWNMAVGESRCARLQNCCRIFFSKQQSRNERFVPAALCWNDLFSKISFQESSQRKSFLNLMFQLE